MFTDSMLGLDDWTNVTDPMFNETLDANVTDDGMHTTMLTTMGTTGTTGSTTPEPCTSYTRPLCNPYMIAAYNFAAHGIIVNYCVGIPGATLTMILLARMRPFNSASVWLFSMSLFDFINLTFRAFKTILLDQAGVTGWTDGYCRAYYIIAYSTQHAGYLVLVGLTVERFIAVWFPLKMVTLCKKKWALIGVIGISIVCLSMDMQFIRHMRVGYSTGYCVIRRKYRSLWEYIYMDRIQAVLLRVFPIFILIILNGLIIFKLMRNKGIQSKMSDHQVKEKQKQQRAINSMLTAATIWFIICVTPELVYLYTRQFWGDGRDPHVHMIKWICMNAFSSLVLYNHSGNFILYVIAARKFRNEFIRLVTCGMINLNEKSIFGKSSKKSAPSTQVTSAS